MFHSLLGAKICQKPMRGTMNKTDLIKKLSQSTGRKQKDCKELVEAVLELLQKAVCAEEDVLLQGFGTFKLKYKQARTAKNPSTGKAIEIPEKYVPVFSPAKAFVELCNNFDTSDTSDSYDEDIENDE